jgi:hypothetical protein
MRKILLIIVSQMIYGSILIAREVDSERRKITPSYSIAGTVKSSYGNQFHYSYHFDHNALKDAVLAGGSLYALTDSGNIVRFDSNSLSISGQRIIPGCGASITLSDNGRIFVGTELGQIYEVDARTLKLKPILKTAGLIYWLTVKSESDNRKIKIIAAVNNYPLIWGRPGELSAHYEKRRDRLMAQRQPSFYILVHTDKQEQRFPLSLGPDNSIPNAFMLDNPDCLLIGKDMGEFGGQYWSMNLNTGKTVLFEVGGVLGFLRCKDGRLLVYGGTSHMGFDSGYIARIDKIDFELLREFSSSIWPDAKKNVSEPVLKDNDNADSINSANIPVEPIDRIIEDKEGNGFWVLSGHKIFRCDKSLAKWEKITDLEGRWIPGRNYSVGSTTAVNQVIPIHFNPVEFIAVMGRDGLVCVEGDTVRHAKVLTQMESPIVEIWPTSQGIVFLADTFVQAVIGWHWRGNLWEKLVFYPNRKPIRNDDIDSGWYEYEPIGEENSHLWGYYNESVRPGENGFIKVGITGRKQESERWNNNDFSLNAFLMTQDGKILGFSRYAEDKELKQWDGNSWKTAGKHNIDDSMIHIPKTAGRRYIPVAISGTTEVFFNSTYGNFIQLKKNDNTYQLQYLNAEKITAPTGVSDTVYDKDGWILFASAERIGRYNPWKKRIKTIPSPNRNEEFTSICRDGKGRLWVVGDNLYVSSDEGKKWELVLLPMVSRTSAGRVRPDPQKVDGLILSLYNRGVVFLR